MRCVCYDIFLDTHTPHYPRDSDRPSCTWLWLPLFLSVKVSVEVTQTHCGSAALCELGTEGGCQSVQNDNFKLPQPCRYLHLGTLSTTFTLPFTLWIEQPGLGAIVVNLLGCWSQEWMMKESSLTPTGLYKKRFITKKVKYLSGIWTAGGGCGSRCAQNSPEQFKHHILIPPYSLGMQNVLIWETKKMPMKPGKREGEVLGLIGMCLIYKLSQGNHPETQLIKWLLGLEGLWEKSKATDTTLSTHFLP